MRRRTRFGTASNEAEANNNMKALLDQKWVLFFGLLIVAASLILVYFAKVSDTLGAEDTALAERPGRVALRAQISWDGNLNNAYALKVGERCMQIGDSGFNPRKLPPECATSDVDLWMMRITPHGKEVVYNHRIADTDSLMIHTPDDRGSVNQTHEGTGDPIYTTVRAEQLLSQYAFLPPGRYVINADLFRPELFDESHITRVSGFIVFNEGQESEVEVYKGQKEISITSRAPREVTLVSFTIDANNELVPESIDTTTQYPFVVQRYQ